MKRVEPNQIYVGTGGSGTEPCKYRTKVTKYVIEEKENKLTGTVRKEKITGTLLNQCRLLKLQNKRCLHPNDNEHTCNIPKHR